MYSEHLLPRFYYDQSTSFFLSLTKQTNERDNYQKITENKANTSQKRKPHQ